MGSAEIKSIHENTPLVDMEKTPPMNDHAIVRNTVDNKYYISTGIEWKEVNELNNNADNQ